eukprot:gb/GECG01000149.1/.p1 GENE.gb/GECG01000149.1/~~gb/GECG01000149.1/.p1  ORF type:complete len:549 (+),score=41.48 gb/GECG01000149.1/:1-1647(+)
MATRIRVESADIYGIQPPNTQNIVFSNSTTAPPPPPMRNSQTTAGSNGRQGPNRASPPINQRMRYRVLSARQLAQSTRKGAMINLVIAGLRLPIALITIITTWGARCDAPLHAFLVGIAIHDVLRSLVSTKIAIHLKRMLESPEGFSLEFERALMYFRSSTSAMMDRFLIFFGFIWHFLGLAWVYQSDDCFEDSTALFLVSLMIAATFVVLVAFQCLAVFLYLCFTRCARRICFTRCTRRFDQRYIRRQHETAPTREGHPDETAHNDFRWVVDVGLTLDQLESIASGGRGRTFTPNAVIEQLEVVIHDETSTENSCVICLEEFVEGDIKRQLPCRHSCFHDDCIREWLSQSVRCPLCKDNIMRGAPGTSRATSTPRSSNNSSTTDVPTIRLPRQHGVGALPSAASSDGSVAFSTVSMASGLTSPPMVGTALTSNDSATTHDSIRISTDLPHDIEANYTSTTGHDAGLGSSIGDSSIVTVELPDSQSSTATSPTRASTYTDVGEEHSAGGTTVEVHHSSSPPSSGAVTSTTVTASPQTDTMESTTNEES